MEQVGKGHTIADERGRYREYDYLLARVDRWSMLDLDDLLLEIERDPALTSEQRKKLLARAYAVLWRRAQLEGRAPSPGEGDPRP